MAVVDGERLESQEFPAPAQGGIRLLLVATDKSKQSAPASTTAVSGEVTLGGESRIVIEPGEEVVQVYYVLDIVNGGSAPVNPATPFAFDMPAGAVGSAVLEGSSSQASVSSGHVKVLGPFAPGRTTVQIVTELPAADGSVQLTQRFPAPLERLAIIVKKVGPTTLSSPQIAKQQAVVSENESFIVAAGGLIAAGQPIELSLGDLPHHSPAPRWTALSLAGGIILIGVLVSRRPDTNAAAEAERRRLVARRDKLFNDLVRLENEHQAGRGDQARYVGRREELIAALERIYGALDGDDTGPEPADRAGLAA